MKKQAVLILSVLITSLILWNCVKNDSTPSTPAQATNTPALTATFTPTGTPAAATATASGTVTPLCTLTPESCNGLDDNCDGLADNDVVPPAGICGSQGACLNATPVCNGSGGWTCQYPAYHEAPETTCDDGIDNDCDGNVDCGDSDCPCYAAPTPTPEPTPDPMGDDDFDGVPNGSDVCPDSPGCCGDPSGCCYDPCCFDPCCMGIPCMGCPTDDPCMCYGMCP